MVLGTIGKRHIFRICENRAGAYSHCREIGIRYANGHHRFIFVEYVYVIRPKLIRSNGGVPVILPMK